MKHTFDIKTGGHYQVIVCGGGPAGVSAALAAARRGMRVLLVEAAGQLGGAGVSGGVSHLLGGRAPDNRCWVVGGIYREIVEDLAAAGGALNPEHMKKEKLSPHGWLGERSYLSYGVPFDPNHMAALLDRKMIEAGVDVLFFTSFVSATIKGDAIHGVVVMNKGGLAEFTADVVIDSTGDADVASRAGCAVTKGREEDGLMAPATLMFHVDHVDQDALASEIYRSGSPRFRELINRLREEGEWDFDYEIFISAQLVDKGTLMVNTSRLCDVDGTDPASISRAMMRGRAETTRLLGLMRKHFPGFGGARLRFVATSLGVRETRRIRGDFVFAKEDVFAMRDFDDTIGWSAYAWDLPDPKRPSHQPMHAKDIGMSREFTPIPYRAMLPVPVKNLICPGRAISVDRDVLGILREQAPCYAMGEAAGAAAALTIVAKNRPINLSTVPAPTLRQDLVSRGAIVDYPNVPGGSPHSLSAAASV